MSKEAEEFFKQKTIENAETPRMKKFLALVNREAEGKILQEYAEQQLILHGLVEAFYCMLLIAMMVLLKKNVKNSVKCVKVGNDMFANVKAMRSLP
jgi:hypothetical protein